MVTKLGWHPLYIKTYTVFVVIISVLGYLYIHIVSCWWSDTGL